MIIIHEHNGVIRKYHLFFPVTNHLRIGTSERGIKFSKLQLQLQGMESNRRQVERSLGQHLLTVGML